MDKGNYGWHILGVVSLCLTIALFYSRTAETPDATPVLTTDLQTAFKPGVSYYTLYFQEDAVGSVRTARKKLNPNTLGYDVKTNLRLKAFGQSIDVDLSLNARFDLGFRLLSISFDLVSEQTRLSGEGQVVDNQLVIVLRTGDTQQQHRFPFDQNMIIASVLGSRITADSLRPGDVKTFSVFDPLTQNVRKAKLTALQYEEVLILDQSVRALKFKQETMGVSLHGWVNEQGEMLKQELGLGLVAQLEPKSVAEHNRIQQAKRVDLVAEVMIPVPKMPKNLGGLSRITYEVRDLPSSFALGQFSRQSWTEPRLTLSKETIDETINVEIKAPIQTQSDLLSQADHPEIRAIAMALSKESETVADLVRHSMSWFKDNIKQEAVASIPAALETLRTRTGDCNEHAFLFAGFMRSLGIETDVVAGIAYIAELQKFGYHAWNEIRIGNTRVSVDVTWRQFPADLGHIALVRGGLQAQSVLWSVMGRIGLSVADFE